jgi:hypothetical protein
MFRCFSRPSGQSEVSAITPGIASRDLGLSPFRRRKNASSSRQSEGAQGLRKELDCLRAWPHVV